MPWLGYEVFRKKGVKRILKARAAARDIVGALYMVGRSAETLVCSAALAS
jgi:hypothetical protein